MCSKKIVSLFFLLSLFFYNPYSYAQSSTSETGLDKKEKTIDSLVGKRDCELAIKVLQETINQVSGTKYKKTIKLYNQLAACQLRIGKLEESKKSAELALELGRASGLNNKEEEAKTYSHLGNYYFKMKEISAALENFERSLKIYEDMEVKNFRRLSKANLNIVRCLNLSRNGELAKKHLDDSFIYLEKDNKKGLDELADYYLLKGNWALSKASYVEAEELFNSFLKTIPKLEYPNQMSIADVYSGLGSARYMQFDYNQAVEYLEKSQEVLEGIAGQNMDKQASNFRILTSIYGKRAAYEKAISYNKKMLNIYKSLYGPNHPRVGLSYAMEAQIYEEMQKYDQSLNQYLKAQDIFIKTNGEKHVWTITTNGNIGGMYFMLKEYEKSKIYHDKAINMAEEVFGSENIILTQFYVLAAKTYNALKKTDQAIELTQKALALARANYPEDHYETISVTNAIGDIYAESGNLEKAIEHYNLVLKASETTIKTTLKDDFATEEFIILSEILAAMNGKAECLLSKYNKGGSLQDLKASNTTFNSAQLIVEKMRNATVQPGDRMNLTSYLQSIPKGEVETSLLLNKIDNTIANLQAAFNSSEKNRANELKELLFRSNIKISSEPLLKIKAFETVLKKERSLIKSQIKNITVEDDKNKDLATYENELFDLNVRYDSLVGVIRKEHPKYFNVEYETKLLSFSEIQSKLDNNTTLLEFFVSHRKVFVFVISKNAFQVSELSEKLLKQNIEELKTSIATKNIVLFKESSYELFKEIISPIQNQLVGKNLIIVPDGPLWHLNFDLLLTSRSESNNPKELPYFLRDYAISYANSVNYLFGETEVEKSINTSCLAFSYSDSLNIEIAENISLNTLRNSKKDLPGSRKEIMEIANLVEGDYFYGSLASESNFKAKSANYGILHLALHGDVDSETPENSKLYFTKSADSLEDNFLYSHEIFTMNIPAELTVLSACSTGTGEIIAGEGMMSLGNAFQYAGSKSLLMTQWEISDEVAPELMKLFYTNLKSGMDKPKALQQAKLTYLENADTYRSAPFYWGSFYLVGDTTPIEFGSSNIWPYIILGLLAVVFGIFFFRRGFPTKN